YTFDYPSSLGIYSLSLHDALPIYDEVAVADHGLRGRVGEVLPRRFHPDDGDAVLAAHVRLLERHVAHRLRRVHLHHGEVVVELRSEEHTSELQSRENLVCRLLLEK